MIGGDEKMNNIDSRDSGFRIGIIHGTISPVKSDSEARIQRNVYLSQIIRLNKHRNEKIDIRLFGYEVPLEKGQRVQCVDLLGYDKNWNLYIIELKDEKSSEDIESIIKQVERYKILVNQLQSNIEKEFNQAYFLTGYHFKNIISIVLAPKIFYSNKSKGLKTYKQNNIIFTYFKDRQIKNKHLKTNLGKPTVISVIK
jgi:hypothetical protein